MTRIALEFAAEDAVVAAARRFREDGLWRIEAYTPYPVTALDPLLPAPNKVLPVLVFSAGMLGLVAGFLLQWYGAAVSYPLNIGGRPPASWPAFIPIAFEIAIMCAVTAGFAGFFVLARLPQPYQPIAALPGFERASRDRFFLVIDSSDTRLEARRIEHALQDCAPCRVTRWQ